MNRSLFIVIALVLIVSLLPGAVQGQQPSLQVSEQCPASTVIFVGNHTVDMHAPADLCEGSDIYWMRDGVEIPGSRGEYFFRDSGLTKGSIHNYQRCCTSGSHTCTTPSNRELGQVWGSLCRDLDWSGGTYSSEGLAVHVVAGATLSISGATLHKLVLMNWSGPSTAPILGGDIRIQDSTLEDVKLQFGSSGISYIKNSSLTGSSGILNSNQTRSPEATVTPARIEVIREGDVTISGGTFISTTIHIDGEDNLAVPGPRATIAQNEFHDVEVFVDAVHSSTTDIVGNQFFYAGRRVLNKGVTAILQHGSETAIANNSFERTGGTYAGANAIRASRDADNQPPVTTIENNTFRGYNLSNTMGGGDTAVVFRGGKGTFTGNILTDNWHGIWVADDAQITAEGNSFVGNTDAIYLHYSPSLTEDVQLTLRSNCIAGNTLGIENMVAGVDAKSNWWGDPTGPYHASKHPTGSGDEITGPEGLFDPWLTSGNCRTEVPATLVLVLPAGPLPADGLTQAELYADLSDAQGPVPGATVRFLIPSGMGHVWPTSALTDAQGRATVQYQVPNQDVFVSATQSGIPMGDQVQITIRSGTASDSGDLSFNPNAPHVTDIKAYGKDTLNNKPEVGSPVLLVASYTEPAGYEVEGCLWGGSIGDPIAVSVPTNGVCTYQYVPVLWSHRTNRVVLVLAYEHSDSGQVGISLNDESFDLFFARDGIAQNRKEPNWFVYWAPDGAWPLLQTWNDPVIYDPTLGPETLGTYRAKGKQIVLGPAAAKVDRGITVAKSQDCPGLVSPPVAGIRAAHRTFLRQMCQQAIDVYWRTDGKWVNETDSDDSTPLTKNDPFMPADNLPDSYESANVGTRIDSVDSCNMAQFNPSFGLFGDQEFWCLGLGSVEPGAFVVPKNDWANPGERAGGLGAASLTTLASAVPASRSGPASALWPARSGETPVSAVEFAQLNGTYADAGKDDDGDGLYDRLHLSVGVDVDQAEDYNVVAWLEGGGGTPIAWAGTHSSLPAGSHTVDLFFDGQLIRDSGIAGPYQIELVELRLGPRELLIDAPVDVHTTAAYALADFDPPDAAIAGTYSDQGIDSGSDGLYDLLRIDVGVDVVEGGTYTITGELTSTTAIAVAQATANLAAGSQIVSLDFNGPSIFQHRQNGPYHLESVRVENATGEEVDGVLNAYTTGAYAYSAFQHGPTTFDATTYSDQGINSNSNGTYDSLRFSLDINVDQAGTYRLLAGLDDSEGITIHTTARQLELGTGTQSVHLDFSGLAISGQRSDGPYQVRFLALVDSEGAGVDSHPWAHTTKAYDWTEFEYQGFTYLPLILRNMK